MKKLSGWRRDRPAIRATTGGWNTTCRAGGCFAITNFIDDAPRAGAGGAVAFEVEDLDRLMQDFKKKGVEFKSDVIHSPACRMAVRLESEGSFILLRRLKSKK
ncbi:MAG: hypothetical protein Kow00133_11040 [Amphiplicatus sp.]